MADRRWGGAKASRSILLRQIIGLFLLGILFVGAIQSLQAYRTLPPQVRISVGERLQLPLTLPEALKKCLSLRLSSPLENEQALSLMGLAEKNFGLKKLPVMENPGELNLQVYLFDLIPIKRIDVTVSDPVYVVPGGQSIAVFFKTTGLSVLNYAPIRDRAGTEHSPGEKGGLLPGDIILEAEGQEMTHEEALAEIVDAAGQENALVRLLVEREKKKLEVVLEPVYCPETARYRIGLLVRDNAAGIGTLSFFMPETLVYGALGHIILDARTHKAVEINDGKIVPAPVQGIQPGRKGNPGGKIGVLENTTPLGSIGKNAACGIYGRLAQPVLNPWFKEPIPLAWRYQVHEGSAQILTVVKEQQIRSFDIQIEKVMPERLDGKGMIIRVVDPELIKLTGGIIQGMSGSPIIQKNRLVGVVTHVFVNDPTRGYALMAEHMLSEINQFSAPITVGQKAVLTDYFLVFSSIFYLYCTKGFAVVPNFGNRCRLILFF